MKFASPQRKEAVLSLAFKRRTFGLCFRCLAPDHFIANCRGCVRCLGCGHRERDCKAHHPPSQAPCLRPRGPPRTPGHPSRIPDCEAPPPCSSGSPPAHRSPHSWAAVLAQQGDSATVPGVSAADLSMPAAISGLLNPLFAAQAEALSAELKALYAACLEDMF
jgi:hypothetical protein